MIQNRYTLEGTYTPEQFVQIRKVMLGSFPGLAVDSVGFRHGRSSDLNFNQSISFEEIAHRLAMCPIHSASVYSSSFTSFQINFNQTNNTLNPFPITFGQIMESVPEGIFIPNKDIVVLNLNPNLTISLSLTVSQGVVDQHAKYQVFYAPSLSEDGKVSYFLDSNLPQSFHETILGHLDTFL